MFASFGNYNSCDNGWRAVVAGNCALPYQYSNTTNTVIQSKTCHQVLTPCSNLVLSFANYTVGQGVEYGTAQPNGYYDFYLRVGVKINGLFYPVYFNGQRDVLVPFGTWIACDPIAVTIASAPTLLTVYNRRTAANLTATNYAAIISHATSAGFGEGIFQGTNTAVDYTTGGVPGGDVAYPIMTNTAGVLGATLSANRGTGYTSTAVISVLDPAAFTGVNSPASIVTSTVSNSGQPTITTTSTTNLQNGYLVGGHPSIPAGATVSSFVANTSLTLSVNLTGSIGAGRIIGAIPATNANYGAGWSTTVAQSGGSLTTLNVVNTGFNYTSRTVGAISGGGGYGSNTAVWGPSIITGIPLQKLVSLQIYGNSIDRGVGADDALGDENRSFGILERAWVAQYPLYSEAYIGNTLLSVSQRAANYPRTTAMVNNSHTPTHCYIIDPANDIGSGASLSSCQTWLNTTIAAARALGKKVITSTITARSTSTDSWTTINGQTAAAGWEPTGVVTQWNAYIKAGVTGVDYVVDKTPPVNDPTNINLFRVDYGQGSQDGFHPLQVDRVALALAPTMPVLSV